MSYMFQWKQITVMNYFEKETSSQSWANVANAEDTVFQSQLAASQTRSRDLAIDPAAK